MSQDNNNSNPQTMLETNSADHEDTSASPNLSKDEKRRAGIAWIKPQFLVKKTTHTKPNQPKVEPEKSAENLAEDKSTDHSSEEPPHKKRKGKRGMNKKRPRQPRPDHTSKLCTFVANGEECTRGDKCFYGHSIEEYLKTKQPDIGDKCVVYERFGKCPFGVNCRFSKCHIGENYKNIVNEELCSKMEKLKTKDTLRKDLQISLRKKQYLFPRSNKYLSTLKKQFKSVTQEDKALGSITDEDAIKMRPNEKKKIDFSDKLFLAPLTTVGNLPFRRVCKQYGADITCSEMAMCTTLLQGQQSEWALLKRHHTEDIFGAQVCGSFADSVTKCAELLQNEVPLDFIDINTGCPIDLVFSKGAGCALMERKGRFEEIVRGMVDVLDIPVTVKMRAGIHDNKKTWNAHKLVRNVSEWGASLITVHGRSREQRYTKSADWEYIQSCAEAASPVPLFGNGDVLSYEDAMLRHEQTGVAGLMIARGALIKPWIFTEIKEKRHWDISSHERFEMLKEYVNCGLEHWGSDTQGVENTRRFLLEWLSFLCRYIPVGLLERPPQRINERPPLYQGRDDLETLMASRYSEDWIKISEMLLGPVPETFVFLPKHKANSYAESS